MGAWQFSALAVSDSLEQLAVLQWYEKNMVAGVKDLGIQGETVSCCSSPEMQPPLSAMLVVIAWVHVRSLFLIQPNAFKEEEEEEAVSIKHPLKQWHLSMGISSLL